MHQLGNKESGEREAGVTSSNLRRESRFTCASSIGEADCC